MKNSFIMLGIVIVLFTLSGCNNQEEAVIVHNVPTKDFTLQQKDTLEAKISTATVAAVGDILVHKTVYLDAKKADGTYDFNPMFELVAPYLSSADLTIANQETMIGGTEIGLSDYPRFNSPYEVGDTLKNIGVDAVSLANNHTLDRGEKAIKNAIAHWQKLGIAYTGSFESEQDRNTIRILQSNDITFSFFSYTYGTNGIPIPSGKDYLVNVINEHFKEEMKKNIAIAKKISDVIIVSMHFGNEYQVYPNKYQKDLANFLANEGVDIIIGHHPHVLQPLQWIERKDGKRTFVAYSLGNFISAQIGINRQIGGIVQLKVQKKVVGKNVDITLSSPAFIPTYTHRPNFKNFKIIPLEHVTNKQLANVTTWLRSTKEHMSQWMPELDFTEILQLSEKE
jgi:poly-gamma-glutamate capsule biosynthesis protein CapA/YwtB (metallophosphatase superfamily)